MGPVGAARILGDVRRFASRHHFASWNGTAAIDASSGEHLRHRLSRAGNRRINRVVHIMAIVQIRYDTQGRAYYRRKLAAGKTLMEALRCLNGACPTLSTASSPPTPPPNKRVREDNWGRL